jgi:hypothetical protein
MAYERRSFSETAIDTTLTGTINDSAASFSIVDYSGWPTGSGGKFFARIESETVLVTTNTAGTMSGVSRGQNGTTAAAHSAGVAVTHVATKLDYDEANYAVSEVVGKVTAVGDLLIADGVNSLDRLAKGSSGQFLKQGATTAAWASLVAATDVSDFAEAVSDQVGTMITGNTETGITATYQDADNTLDLVVGIDSSALFTAGVVDAAALASDAVTTVKILDSNVTTGKLATNAVTAPKLAAVLPLGVAQRASTTTTQSGLGAGPTDLTSLSVTITGDGVRRYRITGIVTLTASGGAGGGFLSIRESTTTLATANVPFSSATDSQTTTVIHELVPSAASHTYKLSAGKNAFDMDATASATIINRIWIEDIGI